MADRQAQIPGGAYYNDTEEATLYQRQIPGAQFVNDTQQTAASGTTIVQLERKIRGLNRGLVRGMS